MIGSTYCESQLLDYDKVFVICQDIKVSFIVLNVRSCMSCEVNASKNIGTVSKYKIPLRAIKLNYTNNTASVLFRFINNLSSLYQLALSLCF